MVQTSAYAMLLIQRMSASPISLRPQYRDGLPHSVFFSGILAGFICYLFYVMEYDKLQRNHGLKSIATSGDLGPLLLTWFNCNPIID